MGTSFQDVLLECINDRLVENGYTPWTGYPIKKGIKDPNVIETALRVCKEFSNHDSQRLQNILTICHDLNITKNNVHVACSSICEGGMHWGKFVAILVFASIMSVECCYRNDASQINYVIDWTSEFVCTHFLEWMNKNGDWAGFVEQFARRDMLS
ncbi:hypothetical protein CHS0354_026017 [Potamilus streckersoni]|uniref:Bcl-2 Bcl-2 homology region 1-3 domain-containing protein n=1 Tax=Potamilus streckersoni TaxID=2493646 RepID=A0AAE0VS78_9BIVA|nr:hypothetical protein CHS0354_026017 [Potamilus streckersoni]